MGVCMRETMWEYPGAREPHHTICNPDSIVPPCIPIQDLPRPLLACTWDWAHSRY